MSWYLRKGFNYGPFRFNYSKRGIGTSFGIPGLRLGIDADGRTYVHAGRHGLYYKKYFGGKKKGRKTSGSSGIHTTPDTDTPHTELPIDTPGTLPHETVPTNSATKVRTGAYDLADHLQDGKHALRKDVCTAIISAVIVLFLCFAPKVPVFVPALLLLPCILVVVSLYRREIATRAYVLNYTLDREEEEQWRKITAALKPISSCWSLWSLDNSADLSSELGSARTERSGVKIAANTPPPWVVTNVQVPAICLRGQNLYFLPDGILMETDDQHVLVDYHELTYKCGTKLFLEKSTPSDAKVVETTWLHTNKDGSRDKRYSYNPSFSICEYATLHISKGPKTILRLMMSRPGSGQDLAKLFT